MDEKMVSLMKQRNEEGLKIFEKKYGKLLRYVIEGVLGNSGMASDEDVEECLNDVLLSIWNGMDKYDDSRASLKNYSVVIARNAAKNKLRSVFNQNRLRSDEDIDVIGDNIDYSDKDTMDIAIFKEDIQTMKKLIMSLKGRNREIFDLRYFYMLDSRTIGDITGMSRTAVDNRISRIRLKLRREFDKINGNN